MSNSTQPHDQALGGLASLARRIAPGSWNGPAVSFADWDPARHHAKGCRALFASNRRLLVGLSDLRCREAWTELSEGEDYLKFHFRLAGHNEIQVVGGDSHVVEAGRFCVVAHPSGVEKEEHWAAGSVETSITLACQPHLLGDYLSQRASQLPKPLRDFIETGTGEFWWRTAPMNVDMHLVARSLVNSMISGELSQLQLEAHSLQLLYLSVKSLENSARGALPPLGERDVRIIERAAEILREDYANPPRIRALAKLVGMNDAKLCSGFKQLFNMTISAYIRRLRMERAKRLLETTRLSIIEIALEVGYNHSSNFATAFKRYYGVAPKRARRGSLQYGGLQG